MTTIREWPCSKTCSWWQNYSAYPKSSDEAAGNKDIIFNCFFEIQVLNRLAKQKTALFFFYFFFFLVFPVFFSSTFSRRSISLSSQQEEPIRREFSGREELLRTALLLDFLLPRHRREQNFDFFLPKTGAFLRRRYLLQEEHTHEGRRAKRQRKDRRTKLIFYGQNWWHAR